MAQEKVNVVFGGQAGPLSGAINQVVSSLTGFAGSLKVAAAAAAFLAFKGIQPLTEEAQRFETQTAELAKLVGTDMAGPMAESISELGNELPVARAELFNVAETAARLGIRGQKNITDFTETMGKLGVATDITSTMAADAFARIAKQANLPISQLENLGSVVNELSNTMATSTSEIVSNMRRATPQLARLGIPVEDIAAMGAALNEVSESSTRAGTRLRRLGQALANPKKINGFAQALGMTTDQFKAMLEESPTQTMLDIIDTFRKGEEGARILASTMDSRVRQVLAALAQNFDGLNDALNRSRDEMTEVTSLNEEFARFAETAGSKSQVLQNRIDDLQRKAGENFLEMKHDMLSLADRWLETVNTILNNPLRFSIESDPEVADAMLETIEDHIRRAELPQQLDPESVGAADFLREIGTDAGRKAKFVAKDIRLLKDDLAETSTVAGSIFADAALRFTRNLKNLDRVLTQAQFHHNFAALNTALQGVAPLLAKGGKVARQVQDDIADWLHVIEEGPDGVHKFAQAIAQAEPHWQSLAEAQDDASESTGEFRKVGNLFLDILGPLQSGVIDLAQSLSEHPAVIERNRAMIENLVAEYTRLVTQQKQLGEDEDLGPLSEARLSQVQQALQRLVGDEAFEVLQQTLSGEGVTPGQRLQLFRGAADSARQLNALQVAMDHYIESRKRATEVEEKARTSLRELRNDISILATEKSQLLMKLSALREGVRLETDAFTEAEEQALRYQLTQEGIVGSLQDEIIAREERRAEIEQDIEKIEKQIKLQERLQNKIDDLTFATTEAKFDLFVESVSEMSDAFADFFVDVIAGAESAGDALVRMIQRMALEIAKSQLKGMFFDLLKSLAPGSGASDLPEGVEKVGTVEHVAGAAARGGAFKRGEVALVGEEGPEFFVPEVNGIVTPRLHRVGKEEDDERAEPSIELVGMPDSDDMVSRMERAVSGALEDATRRKEEDDDDTSMRRFLHRIDRRQDVEAPDVDMPEVPSEADIVRRVQDAMHRALSDSDLMDRDTEDTGGGRMPERRVIGRVDEDDDGGLDERAMRDLLGGRREIEIEAPTVDMSGMADFNVGTQLRDGFREIMRRTDQGRDTGGLDRRTMRNMLNERREVEVDTPDVDSPDVPDFDFATEMRDAFRGALRRTDTSDDSDGVNERMMRDILGERPDVNVEEPDVEVPDMSDFDVASQVRDALGRAARNVDVERDSGGINERTMRDILTDRPEVMVEPPDVEMPDMPDLNVGSQIRESLDPVMRSMEDARGTGGMDARQIGRMVRESMQDMPEPSPVEVSETTVDLGSQLERSLSGVLSDVDLEREDDGGVGRRVMRALSRRDDQEVVRESPEFDFSRLDVGEQFGSQLEGVLGSFLKRGSRTDGADTAGDAERTSQEILSGLQRGREGVRDSIDHLVRKTESLFGAQQATSQEIEAGMRDMARQRAPQMSDALSRSIESIQQMSSRSMASEGVQVGRIDLNREAKVSVPDVSPAVERRQPQQSQAVEGAPGVSQQINLNVQAMDAKSFDSYLRQNGRTAIQQVMLRAASDSVTYRRALLGGRG